MRASKGKNVEDNNRLTIGKHEKSVSETPRKTIERE